MLRRALFLACCALLLVAMPRTSFSSPPQQQSKAELLPGVEFAQSVATTTGIAITPLFGVSAFGAWRYFQTPAQVRSQLPWFSSPWFWVPGLIVILLILSKDLLLGVFPVAKKPFDALELLENKGSAVLAAPVITSLFTPSLAAPGLQSASLWPTYGVSLAPALGIPDLPTMVLLGIAVVLAIFCFFTVWLAFHSINVLILLSPFGPLDLALRIFRILILLVVVATAWINPFLGLFISILVFLASLLIAGWSFRLMVFGAAVSWDLLRMRHRRFKPTTGQVAVFSAAKLGSAPTRSFGSLQRGSKTRLCFRYRPWLILKRRTVEIPDGSYSLGRGVLCPVLMSSAEGGPTKPVLRLLPRYRTHEEQIASDFELSGVQDTRLLKGLKGAWIWLREIIGKAQAAGANISPTKPLSS